MNVGWKVKLGYFKGEERNCFELDCRWHCGMSGPEVFEPLACDIIGGNDGEDKSTDEA